MRWKIILAILTGTLIISLVVLPYIAEWYLEKYDQEILGRALEVEDVDINIFSGKFALQGVRILEQDQQHEFLSCQRAEIFISWWQLFSDQIHLRLVSLQALEVNIIQEGEHFNFDDLLATSSNSEDTIGENSTAFHWQVDSLLLTASGIRYQDEIIGSELKLDSIRISTAQLSDESLHYAFNTRFMMDKGVFDARLNINKEQSLYALSSHITQLPFSSFQPYLQQFIRLSDFDTQLNANMLLSGSYAQVDSFALRGDIHVQDFVMIDEQQDSLIAWTDFEVEIDSLDTRHHIFDFGNISMRQPYIRLVNSPEGDNFTLALVNTSQDSTATDTLQIQQAVDSLNTEENYISPFEYIAQSLYDLTQEYMAVNYLADSIQIEDGLLRYYDYTLEDSFAMELSALNALATDIREGDEYTKFNINSRLDKTGNMVADLQISRNGVDNMIFDFKLDNIYLNTFNPYTTYYMAHPFADGKVIFSSKNSIKDYYLNSSNNLFVEQIAVGEKDTANALYELPMKLAVALLRDLQGNVELDVPVEGQLNDPEYKLWKTILQVLRNILLKVVTAPYRLLASAIGGDPQDLKAITYAPLQYDIQQPQVKSLKSIAKVIKQKPEFVLHFISVSDSMEEKGTLALQESWADYQSSMGLVSQDSGYNLPTASTLDSTFYQYIQRSLPAQDTVTADNLLDACLTRVGSAKVDTLYHQLWRKREKAINTYLLEVEALPQEKWKFEKKSEAPVDSLTTQAHFLIEYGVE